MAIGEDKKTTLRKMLLPTAAGVAGAGAGLALTSKRKLRDTMPDVNHLGVGDLVEDLRGKLDSVLGRTDSSGRFASRFDSDEFAQRRREREQRRTQRRARR
jgi:hypothetical protein